MVTATGVTLAKTDSVQHTGTMTLGTPDYPQKIELPSLLRVDRAMQPYPSTETTRTLQNSLGGDIQVTSLPENQNRPSLTIDGNSNPVVMFDTELGPMNHQIFLQRSTGSGTSWPSDQLYQLTTGEEESAINSDISFFSDGIHAIGTYWLESGDPLVNFPEFVDINDPATWRFWYSDLSGVSTYVVGNAVATYGNSAFALGMITEYVSGDVNLQEIPLIRWTTDISLLESEGFTGGVYWNLQDVYCAHPDATSGDDRFYVICELHTDERIQLFVMFAPVTAQDYTEWSSSRISYSQGDLTNPQIAVSGDYHYIVTEAIDDTGNKDIMCYTTKSPSFWSRKTVANSPIEDEMYPTITADGQKAICTFIKKGNLYFTKTEDGGVTWSEPERANDADGTVVETYQSSAAVGPYLVWTDSRNVNYDLYFDTVPAPVVKITEISGGLGVKATVSNSGTAAADNLAWSILLEGGLLFMGNETLGTIETLAPGTTITIKSDFMLGVGSIAATVTVGDESIQVEGFLLGPLVLGI